MSQRQVQVGDMRVSNDPLEILVTYALGSCVAVVIHDASARVGGLAHIQLPSSAAAGKGGTMTPWAYADLAVPELMRRAYGIGAGRRGLRVTLVGGATINDPQNYFQIGRKNLLAVKQALWQERLLTAAEAVGGEIWRTVRLEVGTGRVVLDTSEGRAEL